MASCWVWLCFFRCREVAIPSEVKQRAQGSQDGSPNPSTRPITQENIERNQGQRNLEAGGDDPVEHVHHTFTPHAGGARLLIARDTDLTVLEQTFGAETRRPANSWGACRATAAASSNKLAAPCRASPPAPLFSSHFRPFSRQLLTELLHVGCIDPRVDSSTRIHNSLILRLLYGIRAYSYTPEVGTRPTGNDGTGLPL